MSDITDADLKRWSDDRSIWGEMVSKLSGDLLSLRKQVKEQDERIADLEGNIIEADSMFTIDHKPDTIEAAELALVRMCSMGAEALSQVTQKDAHIKALVEALKEIDQTWRDGIPAGEVACRMATIAEKAVQEATK